jgi:hypothetical protein
MPKNGSILDRNTFAMVADVATLSLLMTPEYTKESASIIP